MVPAKAQRSKALSLLAENSFQSEHVASSFAPLRLCGKLKQLNIREESTFVETERPGCFVDRFNCLDLLTRQGAALFEPSRGDKHARFERTHALIVSVEGAIEITPDRVVVLGERA